MKLIHLKDGEWIALSTISSISVVDQINDSITIAGHTHNIITSPYVLIRHGCKPEYSCVECATKEEAQAMADDLASQIHIHDCLQSLSPRLRSERTGELDPDKATVAHQTASPSETPSEQVTGGVLVNQQQDNNHRSPVTPGPCPRAFAQDGSGGAIPEASQTSAIA